MERAGAFVNGIDICVDIGNTVAVGVDVDLILALELMSIVTLMFSV